MKKHYECTLDDKSNALNAIEDTIMFSFPLMLTAIR